MAKGSISELTDPRQREQEEQGPGLGTQNPHPAPHSTAPQAAGASHAPSVALPSRGCPAKRAQGSSDGQSGSLPGPAHARLFNSGDKTFTKAHPP